MTAPFRLRLKLDPARVHEGAAELLRDLGATRIVQDWEGWLRVIEARFERELPPFPEDTVEAFLNLLDPDGTAQLATATLDGPWQEGWRAVYRGADVGTLRLRPPWMPAAQDGLTVRVEPRGGFGGGRHPSTRLALRQLLPLFAANPSAALLDVGCGGGVLCVAAALSGLRPTALEIAPAAREAARRAFALNGVEVRLLDTPLAALSERFPIVVANLPARVLRDLAEPLRASLAPGGQLVVSGVREEDAAEVLARIGLPLAGEPLRDEDGWTSALLQARS